jgi:hypothetical protein
LKTSFESESPTFVGPSSPEDSHQIGIDIENQFIDGFEEEEEFFDIEFLMPSNE